MKIEQHGTSAFLIHTDRDELLILNNALNEICNGVEIPAFELRIGAPRGDALALLKTISQVLQRRELH